MIHPTHPTEKNKECKSDTRNSARGRPLQHVRDLRQRRGQGTDGAGAGHPEPTGPRLTRLAAPTGRVVPEPAEEGGRGQEGRR